MSQYQAWIGRHDQTTETISPVPLRLLAATLDQPPLAPNPGHPVPPMWHWLYFLPDTAQSDLGPDGHPRRGLFYPDVPMRRRMFAGGTTTIRQPLTVGETATRRREILSIDEKDGSTGPLVLVEVRHDITGDNGAAITEHQTIVYTDTPPEHTTVEGQPPAAPWRRDIPTDPTLLFRFSALTHNTHRIHYDHPYTTQNEGYQQLVVHGPLTLILLTELARQNGCQLETIRFRAQSPAYSGDTIHLRGNPGDSGAALYAYRGSRIIMQAEVS